MASWQFSFPALWQSPAVISKRVIISSEGLMMMLQNCKDMVCASLSFWQKEALQTTWGTLDPPLGNTRLHVVKLLASSLSTNNAALQDEIIELGALNTMLVSTNTLPLHAYFRLGSSSFLAVCLFLLDLFLRGCCRLSCVNLQKLGRLSRGTPLKMKQSKPNTSLRLNLQTTLY